MAGQLFTRFKRRFGRSPTYIDAIIHPLVMNAPVGCVICDISEVGCKLRVSDSAVILGGRFDLEIPSRGERNRCCLVWRNGDEIGVEFVSRRQRRFEYTSSSTGIIRASVMPQDGFSLASRWASYSGVALAPLNS